VTLGGKKKDRGGEKRGAHDMAYETLENIDRLRMVARVCLSVCVCVCVYMRMCVLHVCVCTWVCAYSSKRENTFRF